MGKYLTSLLVLASSILLSDEVFADEQLRRVQEELRKRHLFYANATGEPSRALTAAIKRYQEKKGFAATGFLDSETLASLGIARIGPVATRTPIVLRHGGEVRGANGEILPSYPPFLSPNGERLSQFDPAGNAQPPIELTVANHALGPRRPRNPSERRGLTSDLGKTSPPFESAFALADKRLAQNMGNAVGKGLQLQPPGEGYWELGALEDQRVEKVAVKSKARSPRRQRQVKSRKETNPFVLTFQSINRAVRSVFGDGQTKKKRSAAKRL